MSDYPYFPMFTDLSDKNIVVIGGGKIALRRIKTLLQFTETVKVVSPELESELEELERAGRISVSGKRYESADIERADIVLAATGDSAVNDEVWADCRERGITVNVCSDLKKSDFYFPGVAVKGKVVFGVTASGTDHKAAKRATEIARRCIEEL